MQQGYYSAHHPQVYARDPNPPPYTEYAQELSYVSRAQVPNNDGGYWEGTRDEAVRLLGDQSSYVAYTCAYMRSFVDMELAAMLTTPRHITHGLINQYHQTTIRRLSHSL